MTHPPQVLEAPASSAVPARPWTRRRLLQVLAGGVAGTALLGAGGAAYAHHVEPEALRVSRHDIRIVGLPEAFDGFVIAHLSDIHLDPWMSRERVAQVARMATDLKPDLIALTGDYVSRDMRPLGANGEHVGEAKLAAPGLAEGLSPLSAPHGVWAVLGNHDHWTNAETVSAALREAGARELCNAIAPIERGGARLWACGIDDMWSGNPDLPRVVSELEARSRPDEIAILLMHEPDYADVAAMTGRFSLQLSGHSHGGQVCLPFIGPPILPHGGRKYHTGRYDVPMPKGTSGRAMQVFTSRGIGVAGPRVRFNCPPEIALLTLRAA